MISDYYVNLHFNQAIAQRTGYAFKIGDKGCTFHFHCEDLDPSGMYPHIVFNHPNNTCVEGVPTGSGRDYAYTIQGNEFAVIGKTVVDLKFYDALDATQRISTASFIIEIIPDTYTPFEEASSSYADSLERAREEIDAAILELQGAEHDLEEAETDLGNMSEQFADTLQDYIDAFGNTGPINPRGTYDDEEEYVPRDAVAYTAGGKTLTYINKQACTGIAPTDPDEGAAHWQIMIDVSVGGSFSALSDVNVDPQTLADGQVPVYDATGEVWENKTILENSLTSTATDKALTAAKGKELQDNKQDKELETALTIDGTQQTTVEGALGGLNDYGDALKGVISNENLLLNPFFTVNQANNTSGALNNAFVGSTLTDDWFIDRGSGTLDGTYSISGGVVTIANTNSTATCYHSQGMTKDVTENKTATISIELSDGSVVSDVIKPNASSKAVYVYDSNNVLIATVSYNRNQYRFNIVVEAGETLAYKAVKLELGEISTLANDVAPNQTVETIKCQRADFRSVSSTQATGSTNKTGSTITAGTFFYLNGQFCKALTNIAVNATFTLNTNFKVDSVGDELTHKAVTVSTEAGISLVVKSVVHNNNSLVGTLRFSGITISNDWAVIGNISAHPTDTVITPAVNMASGSPSFVARITNDGNIAVYGANGSGLTLQFCFACETTN